MKTLKSKTNCTKLKPLAAHLQGGRGNPITGQKRPKLSRLFLCLSKSKFSLHSDMVALVGNLSRLAVPVIGISTPANAAAYDVKSKAAVYILK
jgi:hypothetical protein